MWRMTLKTKGLPTSFAESLIHLEDNEQINEVVNAIKEDFDRAVQEQVKEATRQSTPSDNKVMYLVTKRQAIVLQN